MMRINGNNYPPIVFIYGINEGPDEVTFSTLMAPAFRMMGFKVIEENYKKIYAWNARFKNPGIADWLELRVPDDSVIVAHSNGCALTWMLDRREKRISGAVLTQPALDQDKILLMPNWVHVYFNRFDSVVAWSRLLLWNPWGAQGARGAKNAPEYYSQYNTCGTHKMPCAKGHLWYTNDHLRKVWGDFMALKVLEELDFPDPEEMLGW